MRDYKRESERLNDMHRAFAEEDAKQAQADYKELLAIPAFRRVLAAILKRGRVFASIAYDSTDTNEVFKTIGWREFAVDIYFAANAADGEKVLLAMAERTAVEKDRKARFDLVMHGKAKGNEQ